MSRLAGVRRRRLGVHEVRSPIDVFSVRRAVRVHALDLGFARLEVEELVVAASELSTNVLKYGGHGSLAVDEAVSMTHGRGLLLEARDFGRPFFDFDVALRDHHDDRGPLGPDARVTRDGLGVGLGTVARFTHVVEHRPLADGKAVLALRYLAQRR